MAEKIVNHFVGLSLRSFIGRALAPAVLALLLPMHLAMAAGEDFDKRVFTAKSRYATANQFFNKEQYAQAIQYYCSVFKYTEKPKVLYNIGLSYKKSGDLRNARKYFKEFVDRFSPIASSKEDKQLLSDAQAIVDSIGRDDWKERTEAIDPDCLVPYTDAELGYIEEVRARLSMGYFGAAKSQVIADNYADARVNFCLAYRTSELPRYLFYIAQSYEKSGDSSNAQYYYHKFIEQAALNRTEEIDPALISKVERKISESDESEETDPIAKEIPACIMPFEETTLLQMDSVQKNAVQRSGERQVSALTTEREAAQARPGPSQKESEPPAGETPQVAPLVVQTNQEGASEFDRRHDRNPEPQPTPGFEVPRPIIGGGALALGGLLCCGGGVSACIFDTGAGAADSYWEEKQRAALIAATSMVVASIGVGLLVGGAVLFTDYQPGRSK